MFRAYRVFSLLQPTRPRHPLLQALLAVVAVCTFLALLVVGAVIGLAVMIVAFIARALGFAKPFAFRTGAFDAGAQPQPAGSGTRAQTRAADGDIIDGEFRVVDKSLPHGPQA